MLFPAVLLTFLFVYLPMFGVVIAFQEYNVSRGFLASKWVGIKNFAEVFSDPKFFVSFRNTVIMSALNLLFVFPVPILFSIILGEMPFKLLKRMTQTVSYLPYFLSYVVIATIWIMLLDPSGPVNALLMSWGVLKRPMSFLTESHLYRLIAISINNWQNIGWGAIVYISAIAGINPELYEAAEIDGAGRIAKIRYITLPSILGTVLVMLILNIGNIFRGNFDQSYLLGNMFTRETSYVAEYYAFEMGLQQMRYSFASAISLFQSVLSLMMVYVANRVSYRITGTSIF